MKLQSTNKPKRLPAGSNKKFIVKASEGGKTKTIRFGDPKMEIRRDNPKARKNFRSRHGCDKGGLSKLSAKYWSCRQWRSGSQVEG